MRPERREYPRLSSELREQLSRVEPSKDGRCRYRPCRVRLSSGEVRDFVYVVDAREYIRTWGTWPEDRVGMDAIPVDDVVAFEESPHRLPADLATRLYRGGETGMGYVVFTIVLRDGRRLPRVTGNAVDFPALPDGVTTSDIVDVLRGGRGARPEDSDVAYAWCLYSSPRFGRP